MNANREEIKARLLKIEGQVRGVLRMVDEERACEDVLTQLIAIRNACQTVAAEMVSERASECVSRLSPDEAERSIGRVVRLLARIA